MLCMCVCVFFYLGQCLKDPSDYYCFYRFSMVAPTGELPKGFSVLLQLCLLSAVFMPPCHRPKPAEGVLPNFLRIGRVAIDFLSGADDKD